jgi:hypothetical protein
MAHPSRRWVLAGAGLALAMPSAALAYPASLAFAAVRNGKRIGEHRLSFERSGDDLIVRIRAEMAVKLGPVTAYRYLHQVEERWRAGRFERLESQTSSNGKRESVVAVRGTGGVTIWAGRNSAVGPSETLPFTHWNPQVTRTPLFNPQTGKLLKLTARDLGRSRTVTAAGASLEARRVAFRGDAEIDNWYALDGAPGAPPGGEWAGLRGRLDDGSTMEYRRL